MSKRFVWETKSILTATSEKNYTDWKVKKQRKKLSKKLRSIQTPGRYIHVMDDDMFNTVIQMLESKTDTDIQMAKDIILNSKMKEHHMDILISRHYSIILNEHTWEEVWQN